MSRLSKNILYNFVGAGLMLFFGLYSVKYLFHGLGEEVFGIISFAFMSSTVLLTSLNKGISSTAIREVACTNRRDDPYICSFMQTWSFLCWIAYVVLFLLLFFLAPFLVKNWINLKTIEPDTAVFMLRILGAVTLLALPRSLYMSVLNGLQRMEFSNLINVLSGAGERLGIILIIAYTKDLYSVLYWMAVVKILTLLAGVTVSSRLLAARYFLPKFSMDTFKRNMKFGMQMSCISILSVFQKQIDKITISKLLPVSALGYYSFIFNNLAKGLVVSQSISKAAYPDLCHLYKNRPGSDFVNKYFKLQDLICYSAVPIFIAVPFVATPLFTYIFNAEVAGNLQIPLLLLCLGYYMNSSLSLPYRVLLAVDRADIAVRQNLYAFFTTVPLTILFVVLWGLKGAALGWVSYFFIVYLYGVRRIFRECLKISPRFFYQQLAKVFSLTLLTYGVGLFLLELSPASSVWLSLAIYSVASFFYFVASYFFIGPELRKTIHHYLMKSRNSIIAASLMKNR